VRSIAIRATFAAALLVMVPVTAYPANALSCPQRDPRDLARGAQVIVAGVIEAESLFGMRVRVERVYQGSAARTITVLPTQGSAYVGMPWTFYLRRNAVGYHQTDCDGSHPQPLTPDEISAFGGGYAPTPDQQVGNTLAVLSVLLGLLFLMARRRRRPPLTPAGAHP
jgi:hypothetical protein